MDWANGDDGGINTVDCILQDSFQSFSYKDKLRVKAEGRPKPPVKTTQLVGATVRSILNCSMYDKVNWLTGSWLKKRLYCWPRVMFKACNCGVEQNKKKTKCLHDIEAYSDRGALSFVYPCAIATRLHSHWLNR